MLCFVSVIRQPGIVLKEVDTRVLNLFHFHEFSDLILLKA